MKLTIVSTVKFALYITSVSTSQAGAAFFCPQKFYKPMEQNRTVPAVKSNRVQEMTSGQRSRHICSCLLTQVQVKAQQLSHANRLHNSTQMQPLTTTGFALQMVQLLASTATCQHTVARLDSSSLHQHE